MLCKICKHTTGKLFSKTVLGKYEAEYLKCGNCGFIQTSHTSWLKEAYASAITNLDLGLLSRNLMLKTEVIPIIDAFFPQAKNFLDFAGGYGVFTRLMRDEGFNYFRHDPYCENLFAKHFDHGDSGLKKFDLATAFEVFEHFDDPVKGLEDILSYTDNLIFSTQLYDQVEDLENWWYLSAETGQHVAFYSAETLKYLAALYKKQYYCKQGNIHVFSNSAFGKERVDYAVRNIRRKNIAGVLRKTLDFRIQRTSLLEKDFNYVRSLIREEQK